MVIGAKVEDLQRAALKNLRESNLFTDEQQTAIAEAIATAVSKNNDELKKQVEKEIQNCANKNR